MQREQRHVLPVRVQSADLLQELRSEGRQRRKPHSARCRTVGGLTTMQTVAQSGYMTQRLYTGAWLSWLHAQTTAQQMPSAAQARMLAAPGLARAVIRREWTH